LGLAFAAATLALLIFAFPAASATTAAAPLDCAFSVCQTIEQKCAQTIGAHCVAMDDSAPMCWGAPCDLVNKVCHAAGGGNCVGLAEPSMGIVRCNGDVCDSMNYICQNYLHRGTCVLADLPAVQPASLRCVGLPCDLLNFVCERVVIHHYCVL
jgi:hypothetical protein